MIETQASQTAGEVGDAVTASPPVDALIIIPVRNLVLFPGMIVPVTIERQRSIAAAQRALRDQRQVGILMQRDLAADDPIAIDLHRMGSVANIVRYITAPDGSNYLVCQGYQRFEVIEFLNGWPFLVARVQQIPDANDPLTSDIEARFLHLRTQALEVLQLLPQVPQELVGAIEAANSPGALADIIASYMDAKPEEKQDLLETTDVSVRMEKVSRILAHRIEVLRLSQEIGQQTKASLDERQREILLREQLAAIQKKLGEGEEGKAVEIAELSDAITKANMPKGVDEQARKELRRLERMPEAAAEYGMVRSYLEWLIDLPWKLPEEAPINIVEARRILDEDHYGLDKIKQRIIEYLAVRKLAPQGKAPILCFVGPPGVGKTSLGQSIARAMQRKFVRVSLGGVYDEAEIRGHRRTYIGALPGNVIQALRKAGTRNCVMMLDEIDKLGGGGAHGDPGAALLEVLDPEQNNTFRDNYLAVPFDLSRVVFITTANVLDTIPGPLRDRLEIISLAGYTASEKFEIARRYLVRRQMDANGLQDGQFKISDDALREIIHHYTREAGVRNLERAIGRVLRHAAVQIAEGKTTISVQKSNIPTILGPVMFENEVAMRTSVPGVVTGLAWTPVGGDILFIEATRVPGSGRLILTGQLGDVMKESAQAALSIVKNKAASLRLDPSLFERSDIHIHVPAGAVPKDGPSAGVAMFMALTSLLTERTIRNDTAMTGEISLRGIVLPVGGIKEKVIAAAQAGIKRVLLPARNKRDFDDIPEEIRKQLDFLWIERVEEAMSAALDPKEQDSALPRQAAV